MLFVPANGLGKLISLMVQWLEREVGRANYAWHSAGIGAARERVALYFRQPADVLAFQSAFPMLELADETLSNA